MGSNPEPNETKVTEFQIPGRCRRPRWTHINNSKWDDRYNLILYYRVVMNGYKRILNYIDDCSLFPFLYLDTTSNIKVPFCKYHDCIDEPFLSWASQCSKSLGNIFWLYLFFFNIVEWQKFRIRFCRKTRIVYLKLYRRWAVVVLRQRTFARPTLPPTFIPWKTFLKLFPTTSRQNRWNLAIILPKKIFKICLCSSFSRSRSISW